MSNFLLGAVWNGLHSLAALPFCSFLHVPSRSFVVIVVDPENLSPRYVFEKLVNPRVVIYAYDMCESSELQIACFEVDTRADPILMLLVKMLCKHTGHITLHASIHAYERSCNTNPATPVTFCQGWQNDSNVHCSSVHRSSELCDARRDEALHSTIALHVVGSILVSDANSRLRSLRLRYGMLCSKETADKRAAVRAVRTSVITATIN